MPNSPQAGRIADQNATQPTVSRIRLSDMLPWSIINTLLVGFLILLATDAWIVWLVGIAAVAAAAINGAIVARRRMAAIRVMTPLDVMTAWLPGLVALALAVVGLLLVIRHPNDELPRLAGIALLLVQILFIVALGAVAAPAARPAGARSTGQSA